ncbi:MAG: succinylglutamate desuccinylase/aspartoacylase family protein [Oligoflexia bacterium]|nr:succinylglutamate desuccinylase/aspartoacylase family protein [Oligoflexia bacterium]
MKRFLLITLLYIFSSYSFSLSSSFANTEESTSLLGYEQTYEKEAYGQLPIFSATNINNISNKDLQLIKKSTTNDKNYLLNVNKTTKRLKELVAKHPDMLSISNIGSAEGEDLYKIKISSTSSSNQIKRIAITTGVHGNEPITNVALIKIIEEIIHRSDLQKNYEFIIYPLINSYGLKNGKRRSKTCKDLNRSFTDGKWSQISTLLAKSIRDETENNGPFEIALDLHGAIGKGIFIIKAHDNDKKLAQEALKFMNIDNLLKSKDTTYPAYTSNETYFLHSPGEAVSFNSGTLKSYFDKLGTPFCYTVEYPVSRPLDKQITLLTQLVISYLNVSSERFDNDNLNKQ